MKVTDPNIVDDSWEEKSLEGNKLIKHNSQFFLWILFSFQHYESTFVQKKQLLLLYTFFVHKIQKGDSVDANPWWLKKVINVFAEVRG